MIEWLLKMVWLIFCGLFGNWLGDVFCDFVEAIIERLKRGEEDEM